MSSSSYSVTTKAVNEPSDPKLYDQVKRVVYSKIPKHSAYRSGLLVKEYKKKFALKYGKTKSPYFGKKKPPKQAGGLSRWFLEEWRNQRGGVGYKYKSDVYRPTRRISPQTPRTYFEISRKTLDKARRMKRTGKRAKFY